MKWRDPSKKLKVQNFSKTYSNGVRAVRDVVVERLPHRAGIDPFLILIDKNRDDNLVVVRGER